MTGRAPASIGDPAAARPRRTPGTAAGAHAATSPPTGRTGFLQREATIAGRALVIGLAALGVVWLVLQVQFVAAAAMLGIAQVAMLWPIASWLRRRGVPAVLAAILCVVGYLAFFVSVLTFLVLQLIEAWPGLVAAGVDAVNSTTAWVQARTDDLDNAGLDQVLEQLESSVGTAAAGLGGAAAQGLNAVGTITTVLLIALFFTLFALTSGDRLWRQFVRALPVEYRSPTDAAFRAGLRTARAWFYASTATGLVDGVLIGLGLWLLDVPLALPLGALTFLLAYVPLVGATLAGAVAVAVAGVTNGWSTALWALLVVVVVQQIEGNVLAPLLLSRAISFHPLVVLLLTTGAASAFGLLGLFVAVPVAGVLAAAVQGWRRQVGRQAAEPPDDGDAVAGGRTDDEVDGAGRPPARPGTPAS
ncbi:AI-2E family transporter [Blastococcus sp. BMG 814]|uniref:AI-2E family transporter n=1 Tax=Blastococcus carthaginiensis TaxID=3050034 RepID=A0ABT9I970_9ACTN|nr:AI-2E family transporter [Blastococcus carthaginiensis]MDP5182120.1 AI-2E family transporter [Blastococcus carthaginiensis]